MFTEAEPVDAHLPLVHKVARRMSRRLPRTVEVDDLVAAGTVGLLDAARRFDPARAPSFQAFAEPRVRGAILDHLRRTDWLTRGQRAENRRAAESARAAGTPAAPVNAVLSVEDVRADGFEAFEDAQPHPEAALAARERKARVKDAVAALPARTRQVLALYYVEELTLKEIGAVLGVSESRVCQLHGHALASLRAQLLDA